MTVHQYQVACSWSGSTGAGYDAYERAHSVTAAPADAKLALSADPAFLGDPRHLNPEQLLLAAAASCQLLSFLAIAARARLDVVAYQDRAEAFMPEAGQPVRITEIRLAPRITARVPATEDRIRHLCEVAHRECFIANSVTCEITVTPSVTVLDASA